MSAPRPLRLELSPSSAFAAVIVILHLAAAACVVLVVPGFAGAALGGLLLALGVASAWDRALLRGRRSQHAIEIPASGQACVLLRNGERLAAEAVGGKGVNRLWVALRTGSPWRRSVLVTGGMLQDGEFRLLRLWARWGRLPVAPWQLPG